ncbi:AEC family transporter [Ectothiorhodospiraceae bacterium WFHF3C12]|nr:AEC family transporter [Ectothiorhodospiraceae bacterium WFHF3C12]
MLTIVEILAPVFLIVALGWSLARAGFLSRGALQEVNRLSYWFGLPALLFHRLATASPEFRAVGGLLLALSGATLAGILLAAMAAAVLRLPRPVVGTFIQGVFRGNLAFIGLPVVLYAFAGSPMGGAGAESSALLAFGPTVVLYNVLAVAVLLAPGAQGGWSKALVRAGYGMVTNPILIACLAGVGYAAAGLAMPDLLGRTLSALGQMALPLALLCIGGALYWTRVRGHLLWAGIAAVLKVSVLPAIGLGLAWWLGLSPEHTRIVGILLACPTASASYLLATQLGGDGGLASSIVVLSTLVAVPAMILVLWVTGG